MGRAHRAAEGGFAYHVLNRANARQTIFDTPQDFEAFEHVLEQARERYEVRICAYCILPNHWHLVLWPKNDGDLSKFTGWLTLTHTQRWHAHRHTTGSGHLYQGRFKSFPVQEDEHFLAVCRYAERNALRAKLVKQADQWQWNSLWRWKFGTEDQQKILSDWPVPRSRLWLNHVNRPQTMAELEAIRLSVRRGQPYGSQPWVKRTAKKLGLETTLRARGRPKKGS
jgi:putative transposase